MRILDAHLHSWDLQRVRYGWMTGDLPAIFCDHLPSEIAPELEAVGVVEAVLVQADNSMEDTAYMLDMTREYPWIKGVVGWLPLAEPDMASRTLEGFLEAEPAFRGVRHLMHIEPDPRWVLQPQVVESLGLLMERGLSFDAIGIDAAQFRSVIALAERLPGLRIVIDHLNRPPMWDAALFAEWKGLVREAAAHPNVYAKFSGLGTVPRHPGVDVVEFLRPAAAHAVECLGTGRVFCGGDWPISLIDRGYAETWESLRRLVEAVVPASGREAVLYGNAKAFYGI